MEDLKTVDRRWIVALWGVIALALALRLYGLARHSIWYDESTTLFGLLSIDRSLTFLRPDEFRIIPLNSIFLFFWHGMVSNWFGVEMGSERSDFLLRLLPLTFGVLTVPMTYVAGHYITGSRKTGIIAALLTAVSPFNIYYAQELRPHTLYALLVLAAFYASYRALEENRLRWWVATVAFTSLSYYAYYFACFFMVAINLYALSMWKVYRPRLRPWVLSQTALGITLVPGILLALIVFRTHDRAEEHWFRSPNLETLGITVKNFFAGYSPHAAIYWPLFLLVLVAIGAGLFNLRARPRVAILLLMGGLLPMLIQIAFWATQSFAFYTHRAQLAYSPPIVILVAAGLASLKGKWATPAALTLVLGLTAPTLADHYAQRIHPMEHHRMGARYKIGNRPASHYIKAHERAGDFIVHSSTVTHGPFLYHYMRDADQAFVGFTNEEYLDHARSYPDEKIWESIGFVPRRIETVTGNASRVWYAMSWWELGEAHLLGRELRAWLDANALRLDERDFDGLHLYLYDKDPELRKAAPRSIVADTGTYEVPYYDFAESELDAEDVSRWEEAFEGVFPPEASADGLAIDTWLNPLGDGFVDVGDTSYRAVVDMANRGPLTRTVNVRTYEAERFVRAMSFRREEDSDVWRPLHSHYGKIGFRARLSEATPEGRVQGEVALAAGPHDVYVQMYRDVGARNELRGRLDLYHIGRHGERVPVGGAHGQVTEGDSGWQWVSLGVVTSSGSPITLELVAQNIDGLPAAQVDIDWLMFVQPSAAPGSPRPAQVIEVTLPPFEGTQVELSGAGPNAPVGEVYVEIFEPEYEVFRNLLVDVGQANRLGEVTP